MRHLLACLAVLAAVNVTAQVDGFQLPYNPDVEPDGYIGVGDVLELLAMFGSQFSPSNFYVSDDSSHVLLDVGSRRSFDCEAMCSSLNGSWRVATTTDLWRHWGDLPYGSWWVSDGVSDYDFLTYYMTKNSPNTSPQVDLSGYNLSDLPNYAKGCYCATQERPKVEYLVFDPMESISTDGAVEFDSWLNEKAQEGWKLMPTPSAYAEPGTWVFLWRWAD